MAIIWNDIFKTGVDEIDSQHKTLFTNLNKFEQLMRAGKGAEGIKETFEFLGNYAKTHFAFEENLMEKLKCPVGDRNKIAHERFLMAYGNLQRRFEEEGANELLLNQIHSMVENWLKSHICEVDVNLRACAKN